MKPDQSLVKSHPIPGAIVAGILLFALPGPTFWNYVLAAGYFGFLILIASMGDMMERGREIGSKTTVDPQAMARWLPIAVVLLLLCGVAGIGLPALSRLREREFGQRRESGMRPFPARPWGQTMDGPSNPGQRSPQLNRNAAPPQSENRPEPGGRNGRGEPPPPPPPVDYRDLGIKALALLVAAAVMLWIARRYGSAISRFFGRVARFVVGPIVRWIDARREQAKTRRHEARLRTEMERQGNPYDPLPTEPTVEDLPAVYRSLVASAYLLGTEPKDSETVPQFVNRLADDFRLERRLLATVGQVCSRGVFAPTPPTGEERRAASEAATSLSRRIQGQIPDRTLEERKLAYRRLLAERALADEQPD